jgi:hypothetical protein
LKSAFRSEALEFEEVAIEGEKLLELGIEGSST